MFLTAPLEVGAVLDLEAGVGFADLGDDLLGVGLGSADVHEIDGGGLDVREPQAVLFVEVVRQGVVPGIHRVRKQQIAEPEQDGVEAEVAGYVQQEIAAFAGLKTIQDEKDYALHAGADCAPFDQPGMAGIPIDGLHRKGFSYA